MILSWRRTITLSLVEFGRIRLSSCFIVKFVFTLLSILGLRIIAIKLTDAATPCCVNHFLRFVNLYQFAIDCSLRYTCLVFIIELIVCDGLIGSSGRIWNIIQGMMACNQWIYLLYCRNLLLRIALTLDDLLRWHLFLLLRCLKIGCETAKHGCLLAWFMWWSWVTRCRFGNHVKLNGLIRALKMLVSHPLLARVNTWLTSRLSNCLWLLTVDWVFFEDVYKAIWLANITLIFQQFLFTIIFRLIVHINMHFTRVNTAKLTTFCYNFFNFWEVWKTNTAYYLMKGWNFISIMNDSVKVSIYRSMLWRL